MKHYSRCEAILLTFICWNLLEFVVKSFEVTDDVTVEHGPSRYKSGEGGSDDTAR
jgi:hypothetical protein